MGLENLPVLVVPRMIPRRRCEALPTSSLSAPLPKAPAIQKAQCSHGHALHDAKTQRSCKLTQMNPQAERAQVHLRVTVPISLNTQGHSCTAVCAVLVVRSSSETGDIY